MSKCDLQKDDRWDLKLVPSDSIAMSHPIELLSSGFTA